MKHTSLWIFPLVLLLGLCATIGVAELAITFPAHHFLALTAVGLAMIVSLWIWQLLPPKVSRRERHRMALIMEMNSLQNALDNAIQAGNIPQQNTIQGWISEVKADPDFAFTSWD